MQVRLIGAALLLLLAACGSPTNNSSTTGNEQSTTGGHAAGASATTSAAPAASAAAGTSQVAGGNQAAGGEDPASRNDKYSQAPAMQIDPNKSYTATIETTKGTMQAELFAKEAPKTVNNFVFLARENFYQNVKFHRVIENFMVQTGDPTGTGAGGPGYQFEDEPIVESRGYARGTLAMANAGPNTNGSQFFIVHQDYPLPKNYTIFGQLTDGLDTLDAIATTPTGGGGENSTPSEEIRITNITIEEK